MRARLGWTRGAWDAIQPWSAGGTLLTYLAAGEEDGVRAAFGPNYARLQELKGRYDPSNFFHQNQNIQPAA